MKWAVYRAIFIFLMYNYFSSITIIVIIIVPIAIIIMLLLLLLLLLLVVVAVSAAVAVLVIILSLIILLLLLVLSIYQYLCIILYFWTVYMLSAFLHFWTLPWNLSNTTFLLPLPLHLMDKFLTTASFLTSLYLNTLLDLFIVMAKDFFIIDATMQCPLLYMSYSELKNMMKENSNITLWYRILKLHNRQEESQKLNIGYPGTKTHKKSLSSRPLVIKKWWGSRTEFTVPRRTKVI